MTRVRHLQPELVAALVRWCHENARYYPAEVLAIGLALVHGFNEHQMGHARLVDPEQPSIAVPLARRLREMRTAELRPVDLAGEPGWLWQAASALLAGHPLSGAGELLYQPRNRTRSPLGPGYFRKLVADAGGLATGYRVSPAALVQTRTAAVCELRLPLAMFETGYSLSRAMQLIAGTPEPIPLRPA